MKTCLIALVVALFAFAFLVGVYGPDAMVMLAAPASACPVAQNAAQTLIRRVVCP